MLTTSLRQSHVVHVVWLQSPTCHVDAAFRAADVICHRVRRALLVAAAARRARHGPGLVVNPGADLIVGHSVAHLAGERLCLVGRQIAPDERSAALAFHPEDAPERAPRVSWRRRR